MANSHVCVGFHCVINVIPNVSFDIVYLLNHTFFGKGMTFIPRYELNHTCFEKGMTVILEVRGRILFIQKSMTVILFGKNV